MNAGDLRHPIAVQSKTVTKNANGVKTHTWKTLYTLWAKVEDVLGSETLADGTTRTEQIAKMTVRTNKNITSAMRVLYDGKAYEIIRPPDMLDHKSAYMILRARLVEGEGGQ